MMDNTCECPPRTCVSIDVDEKLALLNGRNTSAHSIDVESIYASENSNRKPANVLSETSITTTDTSPSEKKIFSAPPGVIPYHVKSSRIRKKPGGQRLIFVWPQKNISRGSCLTWLVPLVRRLLIGLVYLGAIHIWPGEFLPTTVLLTPPIPKLPLKCTIIEPLWEDDDTTLS